MLTSEVLDAAADPQPCELVQGGWCIIRDYQFLSGPTYEAAVVIKITAKQVNANAHFRTIHPLDQVTAMPDESTAKAIVARIASAKAEAERRKRAAATYYRETADKLLSPFRRC